MLAQYSSSSDGVPDGNTGGGRGVKVWKKRIGYNVVETQKRILLGVALLELSKNEEIRRMQKL